MVFILSGKTNENFLKFVLKVIYFREENLGVNYKLLINRNGFFDGTDWLINLSCHSEGLKFSVVHNLCCKMFMRPGPGTDPINILQHKFYLMQFLSILISYSNSSTN